MSNINNKIFSGAALMVGLRLCLKSMGLVSTIILARLLNPDDFGLIALAMSIYAFIQLLNSFGFDMALIQNQAATDAHYNTSWTLSLIVGLIAGGIMLVLASPMADYYQDSRFTDVAYCLSLMFLINSLTNIGTVNFRKNMNFKLEFAFEFSTKLLSVGFTLILAYSLRSYLALAFGMIFSSLIRVILSYVMSSYRPKLCLSKLGELFSFSGWLLINNVLNYINLKAKDLIIGKLAGVQFVGHYSIADEFANLSSSEFVAAVNRATFPGYAKVSHNLIELKQLYLKVLSSIAIIGIPTSVGIALVSPSFVPIVLGEKWLEVIPVLHILAIASAFISINTNVGYIFMAIGKPKYTTVLLTIRAVTMLGLMVTLINYEGYVGAAKAVLFTSMLMFPLFSLVICRVLSVPYRTYFSSLIRPAISSMVMYFATSIIIYGTYLVPVSSNVNHVPSVLHLLGSIVTGITIYIFTHSVIWLLQKKPPGPESYIFDKAYALLKKSEKH